METIDILHISLFAALVVLLLWVRFLIAKNRVLEKHNKNTLFAIHAMTRYEILCNQIFAILQLSHGDDTFDENKHTAVYMSKFNDVLSSVYRLLKEHHKVIEDLNADEFDTLISFMENELYTLLSMQIEDLNNFNTTKLRELLKIKY